MEVIVDEASGVEFSVEADLGVCYGCCQSEAQDGGQQAKFHGIPVVNDKYYSTLNEGQSEEAG